jgi:hypothetical protein
MFIERMNNEKRYDSNKPDHADGQLKIFFINNSYESTFFSKLIFAYLPSVQVI